MNLIELCLVSDSNETKSCCIFHLMCHKFRVRRWKITDIHFATYCLDDTNVTCTAHLHCIREQTARQKFEILVNSKYKCDGIDENNIKINPEWVIVLTSANNVTKQRSDPMHCIARVYLPVYFQLSHFL